MIELIQFFFFSLFSQSEYATSICEEAISNIRTVRASAAEHYEIERFKRETDLAASLAEQLGYGIAIFQALTNFFLNGYYVVLHTYIEITQSELYILH